MKSCFRKRITMERKRKRAEKEKEEEKSLSALFLLVALRSLLFLFWSLPALFLRSLSITNGYF
jgi:hypothetical protein